MKTLFDDKDGKFGIAVEFRADGPGSASAQLKPDLWFIGVSQHDRTCKKCAHGMPEGSTLAVFLHELGHVVGQAVLGHIQTPEDGFRANAFQEITPNTMREEQRAWEIAQMIFDEAKRVALGTYEENAVAA